MQLSDEVERLFSALGRIADRAQRDAELGRVDYLILSRLDRDGSMRASELAQREGLDPSTLSRRVSLMLDAELLQRDVDEGDRRAHLLRPSERGLASYRAERQRRVRAVTGVVDDWSDADRSELTRLLRCLNDALAHRSRP